MYVSIVSKKRTKEQRQLKGNSSTHWSVKLMRIGLSQFIQFNSIQYDAKDAPIRWKLQFVLEL